ncbi:response regulator [Coleofasciculus sp.]|uniref:response regulator n=1 Tax=Coleofasciculus sp. TaxID=3100458 RepID=UPI003A1D6966
MDKHLIHVLLVEDSPSDARLQRHRFSRLDPKEWQLHHVERLADAIESCANLSIDVVLLDLNLPDADGLETVTEFREAIPYLPIVVLTGANDEELALGAMAHGAQDYLLKDDITIPLLVKTIRYAIERGQIIQKLQDSERRFRGIFNQTFQSMMLLTPEGIIVDINETALNASGYKLDDLLGLPVWKLECWNHCPSIQEWLKTAIKKAANGDLVRQDVQFRKPERVMIPIDFSLKPLKDEEGRVILLIAEGRDIHE